MAEDWRNKVIPASELAALAERHGRAGQATVLCHGCFDIVHPGHLRYLQFARRQGEVLVVSITGDDAIEKGDGSRPYVPQELRAENLAAIGFVDYVVIADAPTAEPIIRALKPDVYIKGKEYEHATHPGFLAEKQLVEALGGRVLFSSGEVVFSSSSILENLAAGWQRDQPDDPTRLHACCQRWEVTRPRLERAMRQWTGCRVVVVGDAVADRYVFCEDQSQVAGEAPILSVRPRQEQAYLGGAAIIAVHLKQLGAEPHLLTAVGGDPASDELLSTLGTMGIAHTTWATHRELPRKRRYLVERQKLLKVDHGQPTPMDAATRAELAGTIGDLADEVDAIIFTDFGYGTISEPLLEQIVPEIRPKVALLAGDISGSRRTLRAMRQFDLLTPTERELRGVTGEPDASLPTVSAHLMRELNVGQLAVTMDRRGCVLFRPRETDRAEWFNSRLRAEYLPALADRIEDRVGAGDAMLAGMVLTLVGGGSLQQAGYLGSAAAALAVGQLGNLPVERGRLHAFLAARPELTASLRSAS